ncbi:hypothetical protein MRX96_030754 [Rhipicephalus microplus]
MIDAVRMAAPPRCLPPAESLSVSRPQLTRCGRHAPIDGQRCVTGLTPLFSLPGHVEPPTNTTTASHYKLRI